MLGLLRSCVPLATTLQQPLFSVRRKTSELTTICKFRALSTMPGSLDNENVAVIGAGVAGLCCAWYLAERGARVAVFETGRGPGGRMSQRREKTPDGSQLLFDHGAQYISVKDPVVQELVDTWEAAGYLADWKGKFGVLHMGTGQFTADVNVLRLYKPID